MYEEKNKRIKRLLTVLSILLTLLILLVSIKIGDNWDSIYKFFGISNHENATIETDIIRFIDVGQGDSIFIYSNGRTALIDTGTPQYSENLVDKLEKFDIDYIDVVILSHFHQDHVGGCEEIAENFEVKNLVFPNALTKEWDAYEYAEALKKQVISDNGNIYYACQGMCISVGDFELTILGSYPDDDQNNYSLYIMAKCHNKKILLTGDATSDAEERIIEDNIKLKCDILKVSHHGSSGATSSDFLDELECKYAVISVGAGNSYNHPTSALLNRLEDADCTIYRTDLKGDITVDLTDGEIDFTTQW